MSDFAATICAAVDARLAHFSNVERQKKEQLYFRNSLKKLYGTGFRPIRDTVKKIVPSFLGRTDDDIYTICELLLKTEIFEVQMVAVKLLAALSKNLNPKKSFIKVREWFDSDLISNWASVDDISGEFLSWCVTEDNALEHEIISWASSSNLWVRRASAVTFVLPARYGKCHNTVYHIAETLLEDENEFVNKGVGWVLREAGKSDAKRLEIFLFKKGSKTPRITLRYAIEKFDDETRKMILETTRG